MVGGYANDYTFVNPNRPSQSLYVGGVALKRAWMYDGNYWEEVPSMLEVRDRPGCTLAVDKNGRPKVVVSGGCDNWCIKYPAKKSVEIYDPDQRRWVESADLSCSKFNVSFTFRWTRAASLPKALNSHRMEQFDGLPTTVGGFDTVGQVEDLYQYDIDRDRWTTHRVKLRVARSSAAVFQVPKSLFDDC